jgi:hypothetical protein
MRGRRQPRAGRYGLRGLPVDEPKNECQNRTDQESRSDWKIEREVLMLHDDVARRRPSLSTPIHRPRRPTTTRISPIRINVRDISIARRPETGSRSVGYG